MVKFWNVLTEFEICNSRGNVTGKLMLVSLVKKKTYSSTIYYLIFIGGVYLFPSRDLIVFYFREEIKQKINLYNKDVENTSRLST